jgi:hypothetical protein
MLKLFCSVYSFIWWDKTMPVHLTLFFAKHRGKCITVDGRTDRQSVPNVTQYTAQQWVEKRQLLLRFKQVAYLATRLHNTYTLQVSQLNQIWPVLWQGIRNLLLVRRRCCRNSKTVRVEFHYHYRTTNCKWCGTRLEAPSKPQKPSRDSWRLSPHSKKLCFLSQLALCWKVAVQIGLENGVPMKM